MILSCRASGASVDVDYLLLELFAGARVDAQLMADLLTPTALTPDRLDYMLPWLLLQTLQAIEAIPASRLTSLSQQVSSQRTAHMPFSSMASVEYLLQVGTITGR